MSTEAEDNLPTLGAFAGFLRRLDEEGLAFAVIGGCAVGAYARLLGETVVTEDLDIYVSEATLDELLRMANRWGASIVQRPQARAVPVAVLIWEGLEINALTASVGLPAVDHVIETARDLVLDDVHEVTVPLANPFDLLANKLAILREKDRPHIEVLRAFVEQEAQDCFGAPGSARARLRPIRRFLTVFELRRIPANLADRLLPLADLPALRRFLASHWPADLTAHGLLGRSDSDGERENLRQILDATRAG